MADKTVLLILIATSLALSAVNGQGKILFYRCLLLQNLQLSSIHCDITSNSLTVYSLLTSQPTANIILLKQLFCTSTIPRQCNRITEGIIYLPTQSEDISSNIIT